MKRFLVILALLSCLSINSYAQDVITTRKGETINAKVTEVGGSKVKFTLEGESDGPSYVARKSSIKSITYENGRVETFNAKTPVSVFPSYKGTHHFEIGGGVNAYGILGSVGGPARKVGPGAYVEYRYAFAEHFDVGAQFNYKYGRGHSSFLGPDEPTTHFVDNQIALKALFDYNVCPSRLASPYLGIGLGCGGMFDKSLEYGHVDKYPYGILGGRIGVQIWHFRLAIECDFAIKRPYGFSSFETSTCLNLGITF